MNKSDGLRCAIALAMTVVIAYGALALLLLVWPGLAAGIMKALFHALDLFHIQPGPDLLRFPYSVYALAAAMVSLLGLGFLYLWIRNKLLG